MASPRVPESHGDGVWARPRRPIDIPYLSNGLNGDSPDSTLDAGRIRQTNRTLTSAISGHVRIERVKASWERQTHHQDH